MPTNPLSRPNQFPAREDSNRLDLRTSCRIDSYRLMLPSGEDVITSASENTKSLRLCQA